MSGVYGTSCSRNLEVSPPAADPPMPDFRPGRGSPVPSWWTWSCVHTAALFSTRCCGCLTSVAASERQVSHLSKPEERGYAEKLLLPEGGPSIHDGASLGVRGARAISQIHNSRRVAALSGMSPCVGRSGYLNRNVLMQLLSTPICLECRVPKRTTGLGFPGAQPTELAAQERPLVAPG